MSSMSVESLPVLDICSDVLLVAEPLASAAAPFREDAPEGTELSADEEACEDRPSAAAAVAAVGGAIAGITTLVGGPIPMSSSPS